MKTKTINLFEYSELSPEAKKKALEHFREHDFDEYYLKVGLDNEVSDLLEEHKIKPIDGTYAKLYYSLSHSQGDGLMFEGVFDWKKYHITIKHSGHYYHSYSKTLEITYIDKEENEQDADEGTYAEFEKIYQTICKTLEKHGYEVIEDMQSEDYFIEQCNNYEYTFREDGTRESLD